MAMNPGAAAPVTPIDQAPGGGRAPARPGLRALPEGVGGHVIIGKLVFCGTTERSPKQLACDLMCLDGDGRTSIVQTSGWIASNDGVMTALGTAFGSGQLAGLVGSEVAVLVRPRVKDNRLYLSVEALHGLTRLPG